MILSNHPVDAVEAVADGNDWAFERASSDEIAIHARGTWTDYAIEFSWMEHFEALHISCRYDLRVPDGRRNETMRLITLINERVMLGHFDLWTQDGSILFRTAMPLAGGVEPGRRQIEFLVNTVLEQCERYYQALQHVVWGGQGASDAQDNVLFDTVGEA